MHDSGRRGAGVSINNIGSSSLARTAKAFIAWAHPAVIAISQLVHLFRSFDPAIHVLNRHALLASALCLAVVRALRREATVVREGGSSSTVRAGFSGRGKATPSRNR